MLNLNELFTFEKDLSMFWLRLSFSFVLTDQACLYCCFTSNLDETTRSVYKENVRLNAALDFHLKEGQELKKVCLFSVAKNL